MIFFAGVEVRILGSALRARMFLLRLTGRGFRWWFGVFRLGLGVILHFLVDPGRIFVWSELLRFGDSKFDFGDRLVDLQDRPRDRAGAELVSFSDLREKDFFSHKVNWCRRPEFP